MEREMATTTRRVGVALNYLSILLALAFFYMGKHGGWDVPLVIGEVAALATAAGTFVVFHFRSRLWKLIHAPIRELDERELQLTDKSLRYAYSIYSITCLLILAYCFYGLAEGRDLAMGALVLACLIYLAHTLPAAIIAWMAKAV